ncbi:RNA-guided endonuclease TnpB family protein [Halobacterium sp. KA-6]|nr:RNA-guided endonuclease TnpB family protein [Halobacterium sp. KA-6]MCD2203892.1 RNA-guided endonuclease TnpB family protein [Halobacterium sp. KA-6]
MTYARRQQFFAGESVWDSADYYDEYVDVLGSATTQEVSPPGYWGNQSDGRDLRTYIRNDAYTITWGERSRLEVPIGGQLKDEYGFGQFERLQVAVRGEPHWQGEPGRLHLTYDDVDETYRAHQPVTVPEAEQTTPTGTDVAALDIGANVFVACTTTTGAQYWYSGQEPFRQFRETTERIADAKAKLPAGQQTSNRIQRLYRKRSRRRDHAVNALLRDLVERLHDDGVETIYHGDLTGVLGEYWSVEANLKARTFWAHRQCLDQLANVCEEYGIEVASTSEAWTSQTCPECGERERTRRHRETLRCPCGFEGHADLVASRTLLEQATNIAVRPTARPVRFQWDDHQWYPVERDIVAPNE